MKPAEIEDLKREIDYIGRKRVARHLKMTYTTLSQKLGGFSPISEADEEKLKAAVESLED
jgi:hypothetical protein